MDGVGGTGGAGVPAAVIGLLIEGIAATAIQIIGLLSDRFPEPRARAAAFGTFGMVSPLTGGAASPHAAQR